MNERAPTASHAHAVGLDATLDLVNTLEYTDGRPEEAIGTTHAAVDFLVGHDLGHEEPLRAQARQDGEAWLARVHDARGALRELWDAQVEGRSPSAASIRTVNALLDHAPRMELRGTLAGVAVAHRHPDDDPTAEALARAAMPLVEAIASRKTDRFRICANDGCRWVFEDASRAGRRRWCDMSTCGNRAKVRRYRSRHRDDTTTDVPDAPTASTAVDPSAG